MDNQSLDFCTYLRQYVHKPFTESRSEAGKLLHYTLTKVEPGNIELALTVLPQHCNPSQKLHGGIYALIMDEAVGLAFFTVCAGEYYTTVNLNVEHLYSADLNEKITAVGKVIRHGKKIAYTEGEIYNSKGSLICKATSNLINTGKRIFTLSAEQ
jgi:acyl-coenzyme A thioesterase 13